MPRPGRLATQGASPREALVAQVLLGCTEHLDPTSSILLVDDVEQHLQKALTTRGFTRISSWSRHACQNHSGTPWPEPGAHDVALMRLPRSKDVLEMNLHAIASRLVPGGELITCGANDEGAKSAQKRVAQIFAQTSTRDTRKHCRVIGGFWQAQTSIKGELEDWRVELDSPLASVEGTWQHYPGLFAKGRLDEATALLLNSLPTPPAGARVLDFAAGGGVIAAAMLARQPELAITLLDADAIAIHAARANVPQARSLVCSDAWHGLPEATPPFDMIVSNPPIHRGKLEDFTALRALIEHGRDHLTSDGELWMVVQRQVPVKELFGAWHTSEIVHHDNRFNIWRATS